MSEREQLLDDAKKIVCGERSDQYGAVENTFSRIAQLWSGYLHKAISPRDVANMMVLLKVARNTHSIHRDNWVDIAGYAACGAECDCDSGWQIVGGDA